MDLTVKLSEVPRYDVRLAVEGEEDAICAICQAGFRASSEGLLSPETVERQAQSYYNPERVLREIASAGDTPRWRGYVVAVTVGGEVLGAAGGGVSDQQVGSVYVLYLRPALRGNGIGTGLLDFVTTQQTSAGVTEQWVSVTEGNDLGIPFYLARGFAVRERVPYVVADDGSIEAHSLRMSRAI